MPIDLHLHSAVGAVLFDPLEEALKPCLNRRSCPTLSDSHWLIIGTLRALQDKGSGRGFLQWLQVHRSELELDVQLFFESLKSERRLELCKEVNGHLALSMVRHNVDALAVFDELKDYDVYAGDGHFHAAAAHDPIVPDKEGKYPVGHVFCLNLRTHALTHLSVANSSERKREHEMRILKRQTIESLRQGARKGRKVLYVWDRAGIDFRQWHKWKQGSGIYFLSREKDNMALKVMGNIPFDQQDERNSGVRSDQYVGSCNGVLLRRVVYFDVVENREYTYLTNVMDLPPGLIAFLYKMRWDIEKVFDVLKNKLQEGKAWATSLTAKSMQGQFLCLAHNLLTIYEEYLKKTHGITNEAEIARRAKRIVKLEASLAGKSLALPPILRTIQRMTQRSLKFIRWIRCHLSATGSHDEALAILRGNYAVL
jgi:hypothetical protein